MISVQAMNLNSPCWLVSTFSMAFRADLQYTGDKEQQLVASLSDSPQCESLRSIPYLQNNEP